MVITGFLVCYALELAVRWILGVLGLRHAARHGTEVPDELAGKVDPAAAARSRAYALARGRLGLAASGWDATVTLTLLLSGVLPALDGWLTRMGLTGPHLFAAFLAILAGVVALSGLPLSLYATFGVEARFGFNRTTSGTWLRDRSKGLMLSVALGIPLLYGAHAFHARTGAAWWLWLFLFLAAVQLTLAWLWPSLIAPLFNTYAPLPEGELRLRLTALAERTGFRSGGLYVMDASRRSGHANAFFAGIVRPRIVLFDSLVQGMPVDEAVAVLAHEIGHYRARHVHRGLALSLAGQLVGLWVLAQLATWPPLFEAFGFPGRSFHATLALTGLGGGAFTFFLAPLGAWLSRRHEYQADRYAVQVTGRGEPLAAALTRLHQINLANLAPHPWVVAWSYSHPTLPQRIAAIRTGEGL